MSTQTETKPTETKPTETAPETCPHCGSQYNRHSRISSVYDCGTRVSGNKHVLSKACLIIKRLKDDLAAGQANMFPKL